MSGLRKKFHKVWSVFMALVMVLSMGLTVPVKADSVDLEDGYYQAVLDFTDWSGENYAYSGINISERVLLIKSSSGYMLQFQVNSYSTYEAVYMVKQNKNEDISEIDLEKGGKIGTDWNGINEKELTDYGEMTEGGYADAQLNDSFTKLTPSSVDTVTDTAVFNIIGFNPQEKLGLIGYHPQCRTAGMLKSHCSSITVKINPDNLNKTQLLYVPYGYAQPVLSLHFTRVYGSTSYTSFGRNEKWENENEYTSSVFNEDAVSKVEYNADTENSTVQAKIYLKEEYKDLGLIVNAAESRSAEGVSADYYEAYVAGNRGITWSDNLYDAENNYILVTFDSNMLLYGRMFRVSTNKTGNKRGMVATWYLSDSDYGNNEVWNTDYGIIYENSRRNLTGSVQLEATVNTDTEAVESIKKVADGEQYIVYTINLKKDGSNYNPRNKGVIKVPLPESFSEKRFYAEVTYKKNGALNMSLSWPENLEIIEENGKRYLTFSAKQEIINGGSIAIAQINTLADVFALEPGVYKAEVNFLKAGTEAQTSMASGCLDKSAYLVVSENGDKEVYLNFHGLLLDSATSDDKAYMGALYNTVREDCIYYDYETNESGALLGNAGFNPITEFPCVKSVKIKLSDSTYKDGKYSFWVIPPAMGSGQAFEQINNDPIAAEFVFYSVTKADEEIALPAYQKSVLRRSVDKAKMYEESSYSTDSWKALKTALDDGEKFYLSLTGDAGTDLTVSESIKEKSEAIETAIRNLVENTDLTDARKALFVSIEEAKKVEQGDKTDTAFRVLQTAIEAAEAVCNHSNVTVSELDEAKSVLEDEVEKFKNSDEVSILDKNNLKDGVYAVHADMIKTDRRSKSMADNAINHTVKLEVIDGEYFITLDFGGITIENRFGYLKNLSYYDEGYRFGEYGTINGDVVSAEVLSTQKDSEGKDVLDRYNDENNLYPDIVRVKIVPSAIADEDGYVPLHVFVPIMEAIAVGNGDQDVLMKIDWTTLKETTADDPDFEPEEPIEQSPSVDLTDEDTGVKIHGDKGVFEEGVRLSVTEITSGAEYDGAAAVLRDAGGKFALYDVKFMGTDGKEVSPNGTVTISFPVRDGWNGDNIAVYRINEDGTKTLVKGAVSAGYYSIITKTGAEYAVVEKGSAVNEGGNTVNSGNKHSNGDGLPSGSIGGSPKTGDYSNASRYWVLMISAGMLGIVSAMKRRKFKLKG